MADKVANDGARSDDAERALGRAFALGVPVLTVLGFCGAWALFGMGPALLVLAGGILLGVIALFWASLRTLSGDAPIAEGLVAVNVNMRAASSESSAEKMRRVKLALKDLKHEHAIRKIDDVDYAEIESKYREEAKSLMRKADLEIEPLRAKAEEMARAHLAKKGFGEVGAGASGASPVSVKRGRSIKERLDEETAKPTARDESGDESSDDVGEAAASPAKGARVTCHACTTSNEPDATFCKKCGASLARIDCPKCASSNEPDATFCKKCGTSLASPAPTKDTKDATV